VTYILGCRVALRFDLHSFRSRRSLAYSTIILDLTKVSTNQTWHRMTNTKLALHMP
jgi:hypothetical protein